ncbi:MAG: class I SAM-dependent methyltransferase [Nitriliruptoraceae bacterium]
MAIHDEFDLKAATWDDDPAKVARAQRVAGLIRDHVRLDEQMNVLEYGAGTGLVSEALVGHVGHITVSDRSAGMLEVLRAKAEAGRLGNADVADLDLATSSDLNTTFDLIVSVMVMHHIPEVNNVLTQLRTIISADGYACIADLDAEDGSFHGAGFAGHNGFDRAQFASDLRRAGFNTVEFLDAGTVTKDSGEFGLFLAIAQP